MLAAGRPHMRPQQLHTQAAWFGVDAQRLSNLLEAPMLSPTVEVRTAKRATRPQPAPATLETPTPWREAGQIRWIFPKKLLIG